MQKRLDMLVCEQMGVSREYAKELILSGKCSVNNATIRKPGERYDAGSIIDIDAERLPYVSRGGFKIAHALTKFDIDLAGKLCIDIGASTGGFTDCMLQHGAANVIALENGQGQLAQKLQSDCRVISMENTNIMVIDGSALPFLPNFAAVDLSFISLARVIPIVSSILPKYGQAIFLLKPQFECGPGVTNKRGVVTSLAAHVQAIGKILHAITDADMMVHGIDFSPITGQNGNVEYLIFVEKWGV